MALAKMISTIELGTFERCRALQEARGMLVANLSSQVLHVHQSPGSANHVRQSFCVRSHAEVVDCVEAGH